MSLTQKEKDYIVDSVVGILKSPEKKEQIKELQDKLKNRNNTSATDDNENMDEVIFSVIKAIDELYG